MSQIRAHQYGPKPYRVVRQTWCACSHVKGAHADEGKGACEGWRTLYDDLSLARMPNGRACTCESFEAVPY